MKTVAGVFRSSSDAQHALDATRLIGIAPDKVTLLTPGDLNTPQSVPISATEQPGVGKAIGAVVGASAGISGGALAAAALVPGVGLVTGVGLLGAAILGAAGAGIGAAAGQKLESATTEGLPEDELFVYEDALRKKRSVIVALVENDSMASRLREVFEVEGAESVDAAREQWWIGLRSAEREHYSSLGRNFSDDEKFYRMGFEAALHSRMRCKEYDQVMGEMTAKIEDLEKQYPNANVAEAFTKGYERGRDHYQQLCDQSRAA